MHKDFYSGLAACLASATGGLIVHLAYETPEPILATVLLFTLAMGAVGLFFLARWISKEISRSQRSQAVFIRAGGAFIALAGGIAVAKITQDNLAGFLFGASVTSVILITWKPPGPEMNLGKLLGQIGIVLITSFAAGYVVFAFTKSPALSVVLGIGLALMGFWQMSGQFKRK